MSAPFIQRNQTINVKQGRYARNQIKISGTTPIHCIAYGLPAELYISDDGWISGTAINYTNRSAFVIATNSYGSDSAIVNFNIEKIQDDYSILTSPDFGYAKSTPYKFVQIHMDLILLL